MMDTIRKERRLLMIFLLLWFAMSNVALFLQQYKNSLSSDYSLILALITLISALVALISLIISVIYVYKVCKWCNFSKAPVLLMTIIYVVFAFIYPLISFLIGVGILWKSRKLLIEKQSQSKGAV